LIINVNPSRRLFTESATKIKIDSKTSCSEKTRQTAQHLFIRENVVKITRKIITLLSPEEMVHERVHNVRSRYR